jgi:hypothetical protein
LSSKQSASKELVHKSKRIVQALSLSRQGILFLESLPAAADGWPVTVVAPSFRRPPTFQNTGESAPLIIFVTNKVETSVKIECAYGSHSSTISGALGDWLSEVGGG